MLERVRRRQRRRRRENPGLPSTGPAANYNGPAPSTPDVQQFKINLWDNIQANNRCGSCHSDTGGQAPMFARRDDINLAYTAANGVVTLMSPQDSTMVVKVGGGHNCWLASNAACGDILDDLDHELGRLDGFHGGSQDRARAARAARPRPEQELPGRPRRVVLDDGLPVARAALLRVPFVGLGAEATAVLRGRPAERLGRRRDRVRSRQVEDESRRPGDLALRRCVCATSPTTAGRRAAPTTRTPCRAAIQQFSNAVPPTAVDPSFDHEQGHDALRGHDRLGRQPLRSERHRTVRVQDGPRLRRVDHGRLLDRLRHERRRPGDGSHAVGQRAMVRRLGLEFRGRQGAGLDGLERQAQEPHPDDGRILDRSVGRARQRRAGRHAHRQLLGELDEPQLQPRPDDVQLRLLQS